MSCCGVRLSKHQSKGISEELSCYTHFKGVYYTVGKEKSTFLGLYIEVGVVLGSIHMFFNLLHYKEEGLMAAGTNLLTMRDLCLEKCLPG